MAQRLLQNVREADTVARLGGDEFVVLLPHLDLDLGVATAHYSLGVTATLALEGWRLNHGNAETIDFHDGEDSAEERLNAGNCRCK